MNFEKWTWRLLAIGSYCLLTALFACGDSGSPSNLNPMKDSSVGDLPSIASDSPPQVENLHVPKEGSRIRIRWTEGSAGKRTVFEFYDSQLRVACTFRRAMDGELRCLPVGLSLGDYFADSTCANPAVVAANADCLPAEFILRQDTANACMTRERVYRRGKRIAQAYARREAAGVPTECSPYAIYATSSVFELGEELPAANFVKALDVIPPASSASPSLEVISRNAEDGFRYVSGWQNMANQTRCLFFNTDQDGTTRCLPSNANVSLVRYADGACQVPAAYYSPACGEPPAHVVHALPKTCPTRYELLSLGPRLEKIYSVTGGVCGAAAGATGNQYHSVAQAVSTDSFPKLTYQAEQNAGARLLRRWVGPESGPRLVQSVWLDTTRDESCEPRSFGPGKYRCTPTASAFQWFYSDASCTRLLWRTAPSACQPKYVIHWDHRVCPARAEIYQVGLAHTRPVYQMLGNAYGTVREAECELRESTVVGESFQVLTLVPEAEFAEVTIIEPR